MIWLTGDHHFEHENIITLCNRRQRNGELMTLPLMNSIMMERWNDVVSFEDLVIYVGDFCLGKRDKVRFYTEHLRGKKMIVRGNHDHSRKTFLDAGWDSVFPKSPDGSHVISNILDPGYGHATFIVSHRPPTYTQACLRLQELGAGSFWIHGHSHGNAKVGHPRVIDVGVDVHNFYPVPLNLIKSGMIGPDSHYA